jgi:hypothetical protein
VFGAAMTSSRTQDSTSYLYTGLRLHLLDDPNPLIRIADNQEYAALKSRLNQESIENLWGTILRSESSISSNGNYRGQIYSIQNDKLPLEFEITVVDVTDNTQHDKYQYRVYHITADVNKKFKLINRAAYTTTPDGTLARINTPHVQPDTKESAADFHDRGEEKEFDLDHVDNVIQDIEDAKKYEQIKNAFQYYEIDPAKVATLKKDIEERLKNLTEIINDPAISAEHKTNNKILKDTFNEIKDNYWDFEEQVESRYAELSLELSNHVALAAQLHALGTQVYSDINQERNLDWINNEEDSETEIRYELLGRVGLATDEIVEALEGGRKDYKNIINQFTKFQKFYLDSEEKELRSLLQSKEARPLTLEFLEKLEKIANDKNLRTEALLIDNLKQALATLQNQNSDQLKTLIERLSWIPGIDINPEAIRADQFIAQLEKAKDLPRDMFHNYKSIWSQLMQGSSNYSNNIESMMEYFNNILNNPAVTENIKDDIHDKLKPFSPYIAYVDRQKKFVFSETNYQQKIKAEDNKTRPDGNPSLNAFVSLQSRIKQLRDEIKRREMREKLDENFKEKYLKFNFNAAREDFRKALADYSMTHFQVREQLAALGNHQNHIQNNPELADRLSADIESIKEELKTEDSLNKNIRELMLKLNIQKEFEIELDDFLKKIENALMDTTIKFLNENENDKEPYAHVWATFDKLGKQDGVHEKIFYINEIIGHDHDSLLPNKLCSTLRQALQKLLLDAQKDNSGVKLKIKNIFRLENRKLNFDIKEIMANYADITMEMNKHCNLHREKTEVLSNYLPATKVRTTTEENNLSQIIQIRQATDAIITELKSQQNDARVARNKNLAHKALTPVQEKGLRDTRIFFKEEDRKLSEKLQEIETASTTLKDNKLTIDSAKALEATIKENTKTAQKHGNTLVALKSVFQHHTQQYNESQRALFLAQKEMLSLLRILIPEAVRFWNDQKGKYKITLHKKTYSVPHHIKLLIEGFLSLDKKSADNNPKDAVTNLLKKAFGTTPKAVKSTFLHPLTKFTEEVYEALDISHSDLNNLKEVKLLNKLLSSKVKIVLGQRPRSSSENQNELFASIKALVINELPTWERPSAKFQLTHNSTTYRLPHRVYQVASSILQVGDDSEPALKLNALLGKYSNKPGFFNKSPTPDIFGKRENITKKFYKIMSDLSKSDLNNDTVIIAFIVKIEGLKQEIQTLKESPNSNPRIKL